MATGQQPKSILKKASYPATAPSKADRDREIALYHANLIQQRKDIELEILWSTEKLIDYPLSRSPYDASNPSPADAETFKKLLRPFQPSDYDELITERNINDYCGYTLCPHPRVKEGPGKYRLLGMGGKAKDFKVVERTELEKWCSEACAQRALYVRVQLSETPAWERGAAEHGASVDLLDEPKSNDVMLQDGMERLHLGGHAVSDKTRDAADLALERGDTGSAARNGLVEVNIREKEIQRPVEPPSFNYDDELSERLDTHLTLEGYTPNFGSRRERRHEDEYEMDTDWL